MTSRHGGAATPREAAAQRRTASGDDASGALFRAIFETNFDQAFPKDERIAFEHPPCPGAPRS